MPHGSGTGTRMSPVGDVLFYARKKRRRNGGVLYCVLGVFMVLDYGVSVFGANIASFELVFAPIDI